METKTSEEREIKPIQSKNIRFPYGKVPVPDWEKRVRLDVAVAIIVYSPGNGQEVCT
jgi:hypothetical protein